MPFNIFAALATGIASLVLGFIWYGPLFSELWMKEVGLKEADLKSGPGVGYLLAFVSSTFMGAVASFIMIRFSIVDLTEAAMFGLLFGLGFVATTFATNYIFAQKSIRLFLIDSGYQTLLVVIATVLATLIR
jgi:uncharacterized membrane protein